MDAVLCSFLGLRRFGAPSPRLSRTSRLVYLLDDFAVFVQAFTVLQTFLRYYEGDDHEQDEAALQPKEPLSPCYHLRVSLHTAGAFCHYGRPL